MSDMILDPAYDAVDLRAGALWRGLGRVTDRQAVKLARSVLAKYGPVQENGMSTGRDEAGMDRGHGKERRAASGHRVIFEGLVAVGGQGAGFEAESVDVSPDGMRLRTAYLPMPGDVLMCRFDAGTGEIAVRGEVVWCNEEARGGEFGLAFVDLDDATTRALRALVSDDGGGADLDAPPAPQPAATKGNRVRLHIEGLGSPMKARVRDADPRAVHVGSALEFLKVGRTLELEDVDEGARREAWVDDVKVEIDPSSSVPQLVVSLRFDAVGQPAATRLEAAARAADEPPVAATARSSRPAARATAEAEEPVREGRGKKGEEPPSSPRREGSRPEATDAKDSAKASTASGAEDATEATDTEDDVDATRRGRLHEVGDRLKTGASAAMDKIAPAVSGLGERAKSIWGRAQENIQRRRETKEVDKPRRVTAPPPAGALKAAGRRVVRSDDDGEVSQTPPPPRATSRKKRAALGAVVGILAVTALWGVTRGGEEEVAPMTAAELRAAEPAPTEALPPIPGAPATADVPLFGATPLSTTEQVIAPPPAISGDPAAEPVPQGEADDGAEDEGKPSEPAQRSWGQGEVENAKVLRLRMDGPVAGIRGEEIEHGFRITVPGRKTAASAASLQRKHDRIDDVDVVNKEEGAVVTVTFEGDDVPGYLAQVKGDRLEIAIAGKAKKSTKKVASKSESKKSKSKSKSKKRSKKD
jgi:hypothetical protein